MAVITNALLQAIRTGFRREYQNGLENAESHFAQVASIVPSTTKSNTYGWLGEVPGFREWVGDRSLKDIKEHGYSIANKDWESTVAVKRTDIEDDNIGIYSLLMQEMGRSAAVLPDEQVFGLLKAGHSTLCYDGQNFFDTDHPVYPNHDGTGTAATVSNITAGAETSWYLLDTSRAIKPMIFQERKKPVFTAMTAADDENVFMSNQYRYGVDCRSNVGFGFWQMAHKSSAALTSANLSAAIAAMQSIKRDGGKPLAINPSLLVVPPTLREAALEVVKAERNAAGATNVNRNAVEVLVTPWVAE